MVASPVELFLPTGDLIDLPGHYGYGPEALSEFLNDMKENW
ncbi:hypothetical protein [Emcibacter sp.]|nr:hypothetical protein [Emcibacter sp.]